MLNIANRVISMPTTRGHTKLHSNSSLAIESNLKLKSFQVFPRDTSNCYSYWSARLKHTNQTINEKPKFSRLYRNVYGFEKMTEKKHTQRKKRSEKIRWLNSDKIAAEVRIQMMAFKWSRTAASFHSWLQRHKNSCECSPQDFFC